MFSRGRKSTSSIPSSSRVPNIASRRQSIECPDEALGYQEYEEDFLAHEPPISPQQVQPPSSSGSRSASSSTMATSSKPPRATTSPAWTVFERTDIEEINPETGEVETTITAKCKLCQDPKIFHLKKGNYGTGTLLKHIKKYHPTGESTGQFRQTTLNPTTGTLFTYNHTRTRKAMAKFIPSQHLPFGFAETEDFTQFCRESLNPAYKPISRSTVRYDIMQEYQNQLAILRGTLSSFPGRVCLTSDMWESCNGLHILCITCHWIDTDWIMQKRIICFRMVDDSATTANVSNLIIDASRFYGIEKKILTVTFDNASNMSAAATVLEGEFNNPFNNSIFHNRCFCHVLNLIVKAGLHRINSVICDIRYVLTFIKSTKRNGKQFIQACVECGDNNPQNPKTDVKTRWNSTYHMLQYAVKYKDAINKFNSERTGKYISSSDWARVENMCTFLEIFDTLTTIFSASYYPTSHMVLPRLLDLLIHLDSYKNEPDFINVYPDMLAKIKKYFYPVPSAICVAHVFDPRYKNITLKDAIVELYTVFFTDGENKEQDEHRAVVRYNEVSTVIKGIYEYHSLEYYNNRSNIGIPYSSSSEPKKGVFSGWTDRLKKKYKSSSQQRTAGKVDELSFYFGSPIEDRYDDGIDILAWWKEHTSSYPILSIMAKDLLTIPISSVASESAFSHGKKQLTPQRSSMIGTTLEAIVCLKDWNDAERRTQGLTGINDDTEEDLMRGLSLTADIPENEQTYVPDNNDQFFDYY